MKRMLLILAILFVITGIEGLNAQSLDVQLQKLSNTAAKEFLAPGVDLFGANMNGGWLNTAPPKKDMQIDIQFDIVAMGTQIPVDRKSFYKETSFRFDYDQAKTLTNDITDASIRQKAIDAILAKDFIVGIGGSTITGYNKDNVRIFFGPHGDEVLTINDILPVTVVVPSKNIDLGISGFLGGLKYMPSGAPQLKIGTLFATQAIIRFVPGVDLPDKRGKFSYVGFGLQHNFSYWLEDLIPVDVTGGFLIQNISLGDAVKIQTSSFGLNVSNKFDLEFLEVTPFGSFIFESSSMDVKYSSTFTPQTGTPTTTSILFTIDGIQKSRATLGANLKFLGFLGLTAEYNFAKNNSFAGILSFCF